MITDDIERPTAQEIADLKRLVSGMIRTQGNRFVKELLRGKKIRIGANKLDFERNLNEAIELESLRIGDVEDWLELVEGWGNQHVYLYNISPSLRRDLTLAKIQARVRSERELEHVWNGSTVLEFPDEPELTSVSFSNSVLRLIWEEASPAWRPDPEKDFKKMEGLDTYEYRAWRKLEQRAITRFEAHLDLKLAALFIANPIRGSEHHIAVTEAKRVIALLMNLSELERKQVGV